MFASAVLFLVFLTCGAEFGTTYEIFPFRNHNSDDTIQKDESIGTNEVPTIYSSHGAVHYDHNVPDLAPFPEEEKLNAPSSMHPMGPPLSHPLFFGGAHTNNLQQFPSLNDDDYAAEPLRADYSYTHYQPPPQPFPAVDLSDVEEIRYEPLIPDETESFYNPAGPSSTQQPPFPYSMLPPIPYRSTTTSSPVSSLAAAIEKSMVKRIMQIVNDFQKAINTTQGEREFWQDSGASSITYSEPTLIHISIDVDNNKTKVESIVDQDVDQDVDESKTQTDSSGNRTESAPVEQTDPNQNLDVKQIDPDQNLDGTLSPVTSTLKPFRYVVSQFIDSNGNPCAKEFVLTGNKKSYYVYTCEEKSVPVPRKTTARSSVINYRDELQTTGPDVNPNSQDVETTTPMTADVQTLPQMFNDYMMYNKE